MRGFQVWISKDLAIQGWIHEALQGLKFDQGHEKYVDFNTPRRMRQYHTDSVTLGIRGFHIYLTTPVYGTLREVFGWGCVEADPNNLFVSVQNIVVQ